MAMGATDGGIVILRLYVPIDIDGAGTGGVPLPSIGYVDTSGKKISLDQATGYPAIGEAVSRYRDQHGASRFHWPGNTAVGPRTRGGHEPHSGGQRAYGIGPMPIPTTSTSTSPTRHPRQPRSHCEGSHLRD